VTPTHILILHHNQLEISYESVAQGITIRIYKKEERSLVYAFMLLHGLHGRTKQRNWSFIMMKSLMLYNLKCVLSLVDVQQLSQKLNSKPDSRTGKPRSLTR
jgi:hypothetical protein